MNIKDIKSDELQEIRDFLQGVDEYGHIYHYPSEKLDEPFKKILDGIAEVQQLMKDSYEM